MLIIPIFGWWRLEDQKFKDILGYITDLRPAWDIFRHIVKNGTKQEYRIQCRYTARPQHWKLPAFTKLLCLGFLLPPSSSLSSPCPPQMSMHLSRLSATADSSVDLSRTCLLPAETDDSATVSVPL